MYKEIKAFTAKKDHRPGIDKIDFSTGRALATNSYLAVSTSLLTSAEVPPAEVADPEEFPVKGLADIFSACEGYQGDDIVLDVDYLMTILKAFKKAKTKHIVMKSKSDTDPVYFKAHAFSHLSIKDIQAMLMPVKK